MTAVEATAGTGGSRPTARAAAPWLAFGAIALAGLVLPLVIARHYGALGAARGDDWSYLVTLFRWVDTGRLEFNNWVSMSLLGQLLLAAPVAAAPAVAITIGCRVGPRAASGFSGAEASFRRASTAAESSADRLIG